MGPQTKAIIAQVILAAVLVGVTIFYAIKTADMATTSQKQFDLNQEQFRQNNRPFLEMSNPRFISKDNMLQIELTVKNYGNIPANFEPNESFFIFQNRTMPLSMPENKPNNSIIYPGASGPIIFSYARGVYDDLLKEGSFRYEVKLTYTSLADINNRKEYFVETQWNMHSVSKNSDGLDEWQYDVYSSQAN